MTYIFLEIRYDEGLFRNNIICYSVLRSDNHRDLGWVLYGHHGTNSLWPNTVFLSTVSVMVTSK